MAKKASSEESKSPAKKADSSKKAGASSAAKESKAKAASAAPRKAPAAKKTTAKKTPAKSAAKPAEPKASAATPKSAKAQSKKSSAPSTEHPLAFSAVTPDRELPLEYGETKVVLLTRDPEYVFAYWEINPISRKSLGIVRGKHDKQLALTLIESGPHGTLRHDPVIVSDQVSSYYLRVPRSGVNYRVELSIVGKNGKLEPVATSENLLIPSMQISEETDVEFVELSDEIYDQIVHLSGGVQLKERLGSDEFLRSLQQRIVDSLQLGPASSGMLSGNLFGLSSDLLSSGVFSGGFSGEFSSSFLTAIQPAAGGNQDFKVPHSKESEFWLEVGVDVIVYGATQPDAEVRFMGQKIELTPDGTFRFRMVFPDTEIEFPIEATSADKKHRRAVKPVVKRHTEGDPRKPA